MKCRICGNDDGDEQYDDGGAFQGIYCDECYNVVIKDEDN